MRPAAERQSAQKNQTYLDAAAVADVLMLYSSHMRMQGLKI